MAELKINGRFLSRPTTGVERYAREVMTRLSTPFDVLQPLAGAQGLTGHAWEQVLLPARMLGRSKLLLSLCNFGPLSKSKQILVVHDAAPLDHPEFFSGAYGALASALIPRLIHRVATVVTVSQFSAERLAYHADVPIRRFHVVPPGVDLPGSEVPHPALSDPAERYLLMVGSSDPRKNVARVVESWADLEPEVRQGVRLLIVGGDGGAAFARAIAGTPAPSDVTWTGRVSDETLAALMAKCHGFIHMATYEGFGLPPGEAAYLGRPVLVSDIPPLRSLFGTRALYANPFDRSSIADGIASLIASPIQPPPRDSLPTWREAAVAIDRLVDAIR